MVPMRAFLAWELLIIGDGTQQPDDGADGTEGGENHRQARPVIGFALVETFRHRGKGP
jgi:hypothetical protein